MDFEIKELPKIKLGILGQEYMVEEPDVSQLEKLEKDLKEKKGNEIQVMKELISSMGLPMDVLNKLKQSQFLSLSEFLLGDKKKLQKEA